MTETPGEAGAWIRYRRNHFSTRLPPDRLYTRSHFWLREDAPGSWRIGLTQFATRMLGDIVEFDFERADGDAVEIADTIGWIEGFKAVSDLYAVAQGAFRGANPHAVEHPDAICGDAYGKGWLYRIDGLPDADAVDVTGYIEHLDRTIDKMLEKPWRAPEIGNA